MRDSCGKGRRFVAPLPAQPAGMDREERIFVLGLGITLCLVVLGTALVIADVISDLQYFGPPTFRQH